MKYAEGGEGAMRNAEFSKVGVGAPRVRLRAEEGEILESFLPRGEFVLVAVAEERLADDEVGAVVVGIDLVVDRVEMARPLISTVPVPGCRAGPWVRAADFNDGAPASGGPT